MEGLSFGAFVMSIGSFLSHFAKWAISIIIFMIALSAITPLLPDDPFRSDILSISGTFQQWSDFINWFVPSGFIVSSTLFAVECKIFFTIYKFLLNRIGANFFADFGTSYDPNKWFDVDK